MKFPMIMILTIVTLLACNDNSGSEKKVLDSGVELIGKTKVEDNDFFNFAFQRFAAHYGKKNLKAVMSYFSKDYKDFSGASRKTMKGRIRRLFKDYKNIKWEISNIKVHVENDRASSTYDTVFKAQSADGKKSDILVKSRERLIWQKEAGGWKIVDQLTVSKL